jgi:hypothetical protein
MERRAAAHFGNAMFAALWALPILCAFYLVWKHCVPVPFWDEWKTPGAQIASWYRGTLTFAELCSQHNESRKLFPRLIYLPLSVLSGWDVRHGIALVLGVVCVASVALYRLVRHTVASRAAAQFAFVIMNLLFFSPRQYENFLYGIQWETFFPAVALLLSALVNLSSRSLRWKTICNGALALLSTYTFANGMALWVLAFPIDTTATPASPELSRQSKVFWRLAYVLSAMASIGCYFFGYQHPAASPPFAAVSQEWPAVLRFFLIWLGSLFSVGNPTAAGAVVLLLFLTLAAAAGWLMARNREWRSHYPWLLLGAYALVSDAATAIGRVGFGLEMAADFRFAVFSVMLYIAIIGLAFSVYQQLENRAYFKSAGRILAAIFAGVVLILWASTYKAERRILRNFTEYRNHLLLVVRWGDAIPHNPELAWVSPFPDTASVIHVLAEHDALRPRFVSKQLARIVAEIPKAENTSAGVLEQAASDGMGRLAVKGWARVPDQDRPADCVVVGWVKDDRWEPRWVLGTGEKDARFSRALFAPNLPTDGMTVRAFGIDLRSERAFPLAGAIKN